MIKQSKFIVRVQGKLGTYDVPVNINSNSLDAARLVKDELSENEKIIAVIKTLAMKIILLKC